MTNRDEQERGDHLARLEREDAARVARFEREKQPHTKFTFEFEVPALFLVQPGVNNILSRITDGIGDAIKVILAQHDIRPLPNGRITIEAVPPKQKEVINVE